MGKRTGTIESIEYTYSGAGNQWTTIDGVRYATWWDGRTPGIRVGSDVRYQPYRQKLFDNMVSEVDCAHVWPLQAETKAA